MYIDADEMEKVFNAAWDKVVTGALQHFFSTTAPSGAKVQYRHWLHVLYANLVSFELEVQTMSRHLIRLVI